MRWMSFILSVTVLALSAFAAPGDGAKFGYNPIRLQFAQSLNQTPEESPPDTGSAAIAAEKLVPGKALLLSAILPGAGQYYAKSPIMAAAFLAIEIGAWTGVAVYHKQGMDKEDEYLAYADKYWTYYDEDNINDGFAAYLNYEYYAASQFGPDEEMGTGDEYDKSIDDWMQLSWDSGSTTEDKLDYLPEAGFTHELDPGEKDQQYYEMIGKYNQFWAGWPADGDNRADANIKNHWEEGWSITNSYRENYLNMRKDSNDALDLSKDFTMIVLANHLAAALHAGFSVTLHNRKLDRERRIEGAFRLEPKRINNEQVTMGVLRINF